MAKKIGYWLNIWEQLKSLGLELIELVKELIPIVKKIYNIIIQVVNIVVAVTPIVKSSVNNLISKKKAK